MRLLQAVLFGLLVAGCVSSRAKSGHFSAMQNLDRVVPDLTSQAELVSMFGIPSAKSTEGSSERWDYFETDGSTRLTLYFDSGKSVSRLLWIPNSADGYCDVDGAKALFRQASFREEEGPQSTPHTSSRKVRLYDDSRGIQIFAEYPSREVLGIALFGDQSTNEIRLPSAPQSR